ncbi:hypothetical protein B0H16DRAFT_1469938 [Mycena metata]|uniref:Uncharacterized protein n=1 Tax=Mycena metata TaxID=1033252 RepID=A0AAD7HXX1_9AGAR|nr:hypothetical protein B0H16DRAFT_1469938 [Mycena metata]
MGKNGKGKNKKTHAPKYDIDTHIDCPTCGLSVNVGTAGPANLKNHQDSKDSKPPKGFARKVTDFFTKAKPIAPFVPSTVSSVPLVNVAPSGAVESNEDASDASMPLRDAISNSCSY